MKFTFPENFVWGVSTAAYQIEGAVNEDGRGLSVWDTFCDEPGRIDNGDSGQRACGHYYRWREDIDLIKSLNLKAYRFSIAWPRIFPDGDGRANDKGLEFYDRLIDGLLEVGIEPWPTLFHWDLPASLQQRYKGWQSRETAEKFADYASLCGAQFGDRVKNWFTINEISCFTYLAYGQDIFAPGGKLTGREINQTVHNALLGHGLSVGAIRASVSSARIGLVENLRAVWPIYEKPEHIEAARKAFKQFNAQILFPSITGRYDEKLFQNENGELPDVQAGDMEIIAAPTDFIGYNYYFSDPIAAASDGRGFRVIKYPESYPRTDMDWGISPRGLYWSLIFSQECFPNKPIYVTENGQAAKDKEERDAAVWDLDRMEYYRTHLEMISRAISSGADVRGYFAWSLMDNFEWASGYSKRFGLFRVNYRTGERSIKTSGHFFADVCKANRVL